MAVTASPTSRASRGPSETRRGCKAAGGIAPWWYNWVDRHRVAGIALVGVIATQLGTYFGYVFPAVRPADAAVAALQRRARPPGR